MRYIILGVDPGKTIGIACLDLKGKLVFSAHYSNEGLETIIERVSELGKPIIVAGDKKKPSELVRRINASFGARIFSPHKELSAELKRQIGNGVEVRNPHERDAYTAAIAAYHAYSNKFKQIEHIAAGQPDIDEIKKEVVDRRSIYETMTGKKSNRT